MKKKKIFFTGVIFFVLLFTILDVSYYVYTRHLCPVWDIKNNVCHNCNVSDTIAVDITISNHCFNRRIVCDSGDVYKSVPLDYVVPERKGVWGTCGGPAEPLLKRSKLIHMVIFKSLIIFCVLFFCIRKIH